MDISSYFRAVLTGGAGSHRRKIEVKRMISREDVEKLVKELTEKPFVMGKNSIETDSFRIWVFEKEGGADNEVQV